VQIRSFEFRKGCIGIDEFCMHAYLLISYYFSELSIYELAYALLCWMHLLQDIMSVLFLIYYFDMHEFN